MRWRNVGMSSKSTSIDFWVGFLSLCDVMIWFTIKPLKAWPYIIEKRPSVLKETRFLFHASPLDSCFELEPRTGRGAHT